MRIFVLYTAILFSFSAVSAPKREHIAGYFVSGEGITFQVASGGCTSKEDFELRIKKKSKISRVALYRKNPDLCQMFFPWGVQITFTWDEVGLDRGQVFRVANQRLDLVAAGKAQNGFPTFEEN